LDRTGRRYCFFDLYGISPTPTLPKREGVKEEPLSFREGGSFRYLQLVIMPMRVLIIRIGNHLLI